ncbi:MAG: hypothetical protein ACJA2S_000523 [Cyclobacteriaceae bacterium]
MPSYLSSLSDKSISEKRHSFHKKWTSFEYKFNPFFLRAKRSCIINNIILVFNEPVQLGVDAIVLRDAVSAEVLETYNESSPEVTISGSTILLIDPVSLYLQYEIQYSVEIGANVILDLSGNAFAGIAEGDWLFTTADKQTQTINFTSLPPRSYGDANFPLNASALSSLAITYEVVEGPISISGSTVTIEGAGNVTIRTTQSGNDTYQAAVSVEQSFVLSKDSQNITFGSLSSKTFGDAEFTLSPTVASGLEVTLSVVSGPVILAENQVIIVGAGLAVIAANQAENDLYAAASEVQRSFTVTEKSQTITFNTPADKTFGDAGFDLDATSDSGLEISYEVLFDDPATITGNILSIHGVGSIRISATQLGNSNYSTASSIIRAFTVSKANQTITFNAPADKAYGDAYFDLKATNDSELAISYFIISGNATISGNTVTITGLGSVTIRATQAGSSNYNLASSIDKSFTVNQKAITITADAKSKVFGESDPALTYQITSGALESGDSFTGSLTREVGEDTGIYTINVGSISTGANYNVSYVSADLTISQKAITITADAKSKVFGEADPALTYQITSGALASGGSFTGSLARAEGEDVNTYAINVGDVSAGSNYNTSYVSADLTISKANQTIAITSIIDKVITDTSFGVTANTTSGLTLA